MIAEASRLFKSGRRIRVLRATGRQSSSTQLEWQPTGGGGPTFPTLRLSSRLGRTCLERLFNQEFERKFYQLVVRKVGLPPLICQDSRLYPNVARSLQP